MKLDKFNYIEVARDLANSGDEEQASFFNEFFKALRANCLDEYRTQVQLSSICDKLSKETIERLRFMSEEV